MTTWLWEPSNVVTGPLYTIIILINPVSHDTALSFVVEEETFIYSSIDFASNQQIPSHKPMLHNNKLFRSQQIPNQHRRQSSSNHNNFRFSVPSTTNFSAANFNYSQNFNYPQNFHHQNESPIFKIKVNPNPIGN